MTATLESFNASCQADATADEHAEQIAWYYDGGGIYRHVSLSMSPRVHIAKHGVYAPALVPPISTITHGHRGTSTVGAGRRGSTQSYAKQSGCTGLHKGGGFS